MPSLLTIHVIGYFGNGPKVDTSLLNQYEHLTKNDLDYSYKHI
jgi:hypothetical protein